ncbi:MAG: ATP-dependent Clp protease proteolytic subunit, partial [Patescibacteria group bacterium]
GSYVGGMKMYDAIKNCRSPVIGIVTGDAFSMTGVVLQACKYRAATKNSRILFHNISLDISLTIQPNSEVEDFTEKIQNEINEVSRKNEIVKQILSERGSGEIGDMDIFLRSERVLPASRALLLNFIDEII